MKEITGFFTLLAIENRSESSFTIVVQFQSGDTDKLIVSRDRKIWDETGENQLDTLQLGCKYRAAIENNGVINNLQRNQG